MRSTFLMVLIALLVAVLTVGVPARAENSEAVAPGTPQINDVDTSVLDEPSSKRRMESSSQRTVSNRAGHTTMTINDQNAMEVEEPARKPRGARRLGFGGRKGPRRVGGAKPTA